MNRDRRGEAKITHVTCKSEFWVVDTDYTHYDLISFLNHREYSYFIGFFFLFI